MLFQLNKKVTFLILFFLSYFLFFTPVLSQQDDLLLSPGTATSTCLLEDEECLSRLECPPDLNLEECLEYRQGQVLAAQVQPLIVAAGENKTVLVNHEVLFSAQESQIPSYLDETEVEYWWDFGDMSAAEPGLVVRHFYSQPGDYQVTLIVKTPKELAEDQIDVKVTDKAIFLILGEGQDAFMVTNILNQAKRLGFLVYTLNLKEEGHDFSIEDRLLNSLWERIDEVKNSDLIIGWTNNSLEVNALLRVGQQLENGRLFNNKSIVIASNSLGLVSRRVQPIYDALLPKNVLVVSPQLIERVIEGEAEKRLIQTVQAQGEGFVLLGVHSRRNFSKVTFYNFLSHFINSLINRGASINTILLILMLPVVATIIALARQIVGIKAFGVYIPTILALTFVAIGLQAGLLIIVLILVVGTLLRIVLKRLRLLYLPRMALLITVVSFAILILFYFSIRIPNLSLLSVSIFPILILIMLTEEFIKVQIQEGARNALILTLETLALSIISFYIVSWSFTRSLLLSYPEIILITFIINFALGKWTGLRLWEYYRFREVIKILSITGKKRGNSK